MVKALEGAVMRTSQETIKNSAVKTIVFCNFSIHCRWSPELMEFRSFLALVWGSWLTPRRGNYETWASRVSGLDVWWKMGPFQIKEQVSSFKANPLLLLPCKGSDKHVIAVSGQNEMWLGQWFGPRQMLEMNQEGDTHRFDFPLARIYWTLP